MCYKSATTTVIILYENIPMYVHNVFQQKREYTQEPPKFSYCHVRQLFLFLKILTTGFDLQFLDVTKKVGIMIFKNTYNAPYAKSCVNMGQIFSHFLTV